MVYAWLRSISIDASSLPMKLELLNSHVNPRGCTFFAVWSQLVDESHITGMALAGSSAADRSAKPNVVVIQPPLSASNAFEVPRDVAVLRLIKLTHWLCGLASGQGHANLQLTANDIVECRSCYLHYRHLTLNCSISLNSCKNLMLTVQWPLDSQPYHWQYDFPSQKLKESSWSGLAYRKSRR